ncbi:hypothetical protein ACR0ST_08750 [Aliidiomarina sp. Khilg15.8]
MSSGAHNKLIGQVGEHLVAAKLGMLGFYASPYAGNVPGFDLTAVESKTLASFPVQVKCSTGGTLAHTLIDSWVETEIDPTGKYSFGSLKQLDHPDMLWVLVNIRQSKMEEARYFLCLESDIQRLAVERFMPFMQRHDFRRPKGGSSKQAILTTQELSDFEDNWELTRKIVNGLSQHPGSNQSRRPC